NSILAISIKKPVTEVVTIVVINHSPAYTIYILINILRNPITKLISTGLVILVCLL
ncbi:hypothetical protein P170DRAFT_359174, partial [Aspergillus steynii IBT 23096]